MALDTSGLYKTWPIGAEVRGDGSKIAEAGKAYNDLIVQKHGTWTGLDEHFTRPADQVESAKSAYDDLIVHGVVVANATKDIETALITYGDTVDDLQRDRRVAQQHAREYNAGVRDGEEMPTSGPGSAAAVQAEIDGVVSRLQTAMDTCAADINGIEARLDTDQILSGPVPAAIEYAVGEGLEALDFKTIDYTTFTTVETLEHRGWANRLRNTEISFDRNTGFPWVDVERPAASTSTSATSSAAGSQNLSSYLMPLPARWMTRLPGGIGRFYQSKLDRGFTLKPSQTVEVDRAPFWSTDPSTTTTTTTTTHRTDSITDMDGRWATAGRWISKAGWVGDVVGFGFMYHDEGAQARQEVYQDQRYSDLSTEEKEAEAAQRHHVSVATNTTIDWGIAGGAALAGAAVGGPAGAAVGFVGGLAVTAFMDWEVFGGKSAKDHVSDAANSVVDWGQKKWDDWFG